MKPRGRRSTPAGQHTPVLLETVLTELAPQPGEIVVDCTVGAGGHAAALLQQVGPAGRLLGLDFDAASLEQARQHLAAIGFTFSLHHSNFAGLAKVLAAAECNSVDLILADLGMSSMQVDEPARGFSFMRDGPLDMRMDQARGQTAAAILAAISESDLAQALAELGDEPDAERIAAAIVAERQRQPIERTTQLAKLILAATVPDAGLAQRGAPALLVPNRWNNRPVARVFQVLRMLVNRELANLEHLLRLAPGLLRPGGRIGIISFHSGEDRLVKRAFRAGLGAGEYAAISPDPVRPSEEECLANPRARSAKFRWAKQSDQAAWS